MNVLVICSSFPPVNATAVHRTVALCRHLVGRGHHATVLTMVPDAGLKLDEQLLQKVPSSVRVHRCKGWWMERTAIGSRQSAAGEQTAALGTRHQAPGNTAIGSRQSAIGNSEARLSPEGAAEARGATRAKNDAENGVRPCFSARPDSAIGNRLRSWFGWFRRVPDARVGWYIPAVRAGTRLAKETRFDVIYSTAPQWTCHLVGMSLTRRLELPWVADCRDPWHANPFREIPPGLHGWRDRRMERRMVRRAAVVVCNTGAARRDFVLRYPRLDEKFIVVHNGYDATDIAAVRSEPCPPAGAVCQLVHAGNFYGSRSPKPLLEAMASVLAMHPEHRGKFEFCQIGPNDHDGMDLRDLAGELGVAEAFRSVGQLPYAQTLRAVREADVAVVAGHSGRGSDLQIPRKLYEYLGLGKPVLVTGGTSAAVEELLGKWASAVYLAGDGVSSISSTMERILRDWREGALPRCRDLPLDFSEQAMAEKLIAALAAAVEGCPV